VAAIFLGLLAAIFIAQMFLLAGLLVLSGRLFRTERPSFKAALKVAIAMTATAAAIGLPINYLISPGPMGATVTRPVAIVLILGSLALTYSVYWKLVRNLLQSSDRKTLAAMVFSLVTVTAVGLAFVFLIRGYLFEAFLPPTGSMAPTILGVHRDVVCPNCGCHFAVSMSEAVPTPDGRLRLPPAKPAKCTNCTQEFDVVYSDFSSGDRILVDKFSAPKRWDVVVFRIPHEPSTNYVKRYTGLPGETLDIADGDLFINYDRVAKQPNEQLDLWFPVNDTQLTPKSLDFNTPHWEPATKDNWVAAGSGWRFNGPDKDAAELQFHGTVDDRLDYNSHPPGFGFVDEAAHMVGDVRILCDLEQFAGDGPWSIVWEFNGRVVQCSIRSTGDVELICDAPRSGNEAQRATGKLAGDFKSPKQIALAVRDGFAYVLDNDRICASLQIAPVKRLDVPLRMLTDSGKAAIRAGHCDLTISRIQLARDIYYLTPEINFQGPDAVRLPISLKPDEIFFLGDNSAQSRDSRYMGPSTTRDVIGVTRSIYWPFSRWRNFP
jgi:signal peptidase I